MSDITNATYDIEPDYPESDPEDEEEFNLDDKDTIKHGMFSWYLSRKALSISRFPSDRQLSDELRTLLWIRVVASKLKKEDLIA